MKILMTTRENHMDKRYGLGKSLTPIIDELTLRGIEVGYLCQTDAGEKSRRWLRHLHTILVKLFARFFKETEFISLAWGILERINMGRLAAKVMVRDKYTHVHCHDPLIGAGYRWFARIRWFATLRLGHIARWGVTEHGFGCYAQAFHEDGARLGTYVMRWLRKWEAKILLKAHWVITPTQLGLNQLARDLSIYPTPKTWHVIPHTRPILNLYDKTTARQQLVWSPNSLYIIAVGRFAPLKQFPELIQACAQLGKLDFQLVFIGEGEREPLQYLAEELGIGNKISFAVSNDMGLYYSAADIYVSTSTTESFGLANLEALVMELPTVCTAVGGVPEVMGSGGWLIPPQNIPALVGVLQILAANETLRIHWQQQAKQWAQSCLDIKTVVDAYLRAYEGRHSETSLQTSEFRNKNDLGGMEFITPSKAFAGSIASTFEQWHQQIQQWQLCPLPKPLELPDQANILLIAPHPDDEVLGCGGTLSLLQQNGCHVKAVVITDGSQGDPLNFSDEPIVPRRQQESREALAILGIQDVTFFTQPDGEYQHSEEITQQLHELLNDFSPDWLLLPSILDYHRDHVAICLSLLDVWQQRGCQARLLMYEAWGTIPATWIVDISQVFERKKAAIRCYQLPLQYVDYFAACIGIASYRGLYLTEAHQGEYAEAFVELPATQWQATLTHLYQIREYQERFLQS